MAETSGRVTLWGIEVFSAVAEEGSISTAARRLGASVSAVSQQVTNLETALGVTLLDRGVRPIARTAAGDLFLRRAQTILTEAEAAQSELSSRNLAQLSRFSLGVIEDFDADVTPRLLTTMADRLQDARFLLETGASHRLYELLETRVLDVIVATEGPDPADWMEVHPLMEEPFVAVAPVGTDPGNLMDLPLVRYTTRHLMGRRIADHLARVGLRPDHRFELDSYHAILAMVAEGSGWSILTPLGVMRAERFSDRVSVLPLPAAPLSRRISLVTRKDVLMDMPARLADTLRPLLDDLIVRPSVGRHPWLRDSLRCI